MAKIIVTNPTPGLGLIQAPGALPLGPPSSTTGVVVVPGSPGPPGPPGAGIYVTDDWINDENNPVNGGSLPAGTLVLQRS